jgi:hypothetical protein
VIVLKLPTLDVTRLAADYSAAVRAAHSKLELRAIRERNEAETDPHIDHVHDYCDANELMAESVDLQLGRHWNWCDIADDITIASNRAKAAGFHLSRILVACEYSGIVRDAFAARGHSVMSCDILPTESPGNHYQGDARDLLNDGWHMMIAHPPCTYLCNSGVKHLVRDGQKINPDRWELMRDGAEFFRDLGDAPIDKIVRENPVMHKYAREIAGTDGADQYIQPYDFGHDVSKRTGLWLHNLGPLVADPANHVSPRMTTYGGKAVKRWGNQTPCGADKAAPGKDRGKDRSKFFTGIAAAMADQWGGITKTLTAPVQAQPIGQMALL